MSQRFCWAAENILLCHQQQQKKKKKKKKTIFDDEYNDGYVFCSSTAIDHSSYSLCFSWL